MKTSFANSHKQYKHNVGISNTNIVSHDYKIGINNACDASTQLSIFNNLFPLFNIIITRDLSNPQFRNLLLINKDKIILHVIVSGYGNSPLEPYTPHPRQMFDFICQLISMGFPKKQIVLRIDPIIPNDAGLIQLVNVLTAFNPLHIKRCRLKIFTQSKNVVNRQSWVRLNLNGLFPNPYLNEIENKIYYSANKYHRNKINDIINQWSSIYDFEICDNKDIFDSNHALGCISHKDLKVFGINDAILIPNNRDPKNHCKCPINKTELITNDTQCKLRCVHCNLKTNLLI